MRLTWGSAKVRAISPLGPSCFRLLLVEQMLTLKTRDLKKSTASGGSVRGLGKKPPSSGSGFTLGFLRLLRIFRKVVSGERRRKRFKMMPRRVKLRNLGFGLRFVHVGLWSCFRMLSCLGCVMEMMSPVHREGRRVDAACGLCD